VVSNELIRLYGVGVIRNIRRVCGKFLIHTRFEVRVGPEVRF
jgi:hypothetical protein